jgi:predicted outer membrane repeat protein
LHSTFANNSSPIYGGAILFDFGVKQITLRADKFLNNSAGPGGGAVFWRPPANTDRTLSVLYSTFTGNRARDGGAIDIDDSVDSTGRTIIEVWVTSFSGNIASNTGGAINAVSSALAVARGIFTDNKATGNGGAVFVSNAPQLRSIFANTLFIRNSAAMGSAFYGDGADFINSTVDSNLGLAIANYAPRPPLYIKFVNSIVSNNPQGGCGPAGLFDDSGHNLQFPSSDCGASISAADPHLDSMYIPLPGSPPAGKGDLNVCMSPPVSGRDVYGMGRPSAGVCTIGAAEGDIEARIRKPPSRCPCDDLMLLKQLQRLLPFSSSK